MLEVLKKIGTNLILKMKVLFAPFESQIYVKDLRKVVVYSDGRKCRYPENYDHVARFGKIEKGKDSNDSGIYKLCYGGYRYNLVSVLSDEKGEPFKTQDDKSYFTIKFLVDKGKVNRNEHDNNDDYHDFYEPFKFKKFDLVKHLPVFEIDTSLLRLVNSSVLTRKEKNKEGKVQEVIDEKGRNGKLLYTSDYKKLCTSFFEIRAQGNNLELDKSLISVPIVFAASLAKVCAKLLAFIPVKLGRHLISRQNLIAKSCGYLLFTPAIVVKNLVNIGATVLKAPILLFVANKKKYGDAYLTMWNYQLGEYWEEFMKDLSVIGIGEREKLSDRNDERIVGTWKELNARRLFIEGSLEKGVNRSSGGINKSREQNLNRKKLRNEVDERMAEFENQRDSNIYIRKEQNRRDSQQGQGDTPHIH
ncbi:hypothetical protein [Wolbachia endosymbiont of Dirofilaria (Dirofilaria) immitis]|uniref:hypothetical protein n=1 Tax=Wolbachia endosymbiont of Dirofilaria (Dirofilaria) immitis TaxID=1812115 RepID=UPI00158CCD6D|nr:hypothetical protein [Wolbachia endosymbiont of Dirofilaria (Dirofilaria) immitis]QKX02189.1 hypothetical protein GOY12_01195 [Wolbachia endosymbiont of Dirofilaria (Dirofilaria) immitis]